MIFNNYTVEYYISNDTNALLFTTSSTMNSIIYVEPISNYDTAGGNFRVYTGPLLVAPTTLNFSMDLYSASSGGGTAITNSPILRPNTPIYVGSGNYTMRFRVHVFELPFNNDLTP